jgi:DNA polymerase III delta subunit
MERPSWRPLPAIAVLTREAAFFKELILKRFAKEVSGDAEPDIRRFRGPESQGQLDALTLPGVLDELRTPSFFSSSRIVVVAPSDVFLAAHSQDLLPFLESGFAGGHLILLQEGTVDQRTRFAKQVAEKGWVVECAQPWDRPPPWDERTPVWDSELSHWLARRAQAKGMKLSPQVAFLLHQRAGTDLAVLEEELEKIITYVMAEGTTTIHEEAVARVTGDLREDSVFVLIDLLLEARRSEALETVLRLFRRGVHTQNGALTLEPVSIALLFIGALVARLRSLRRAHALQAAGEASGPEDWIRAGLVQRPFVSRFRRQLEAVPGRRITAMLERIYEIDRALKSGGDPARLLEVFVIEFAQAARPSG